MPAWNGSIELFGKRLSIITRSYRSVPISSTGNFSPWRYKPKRPHWALELNSPFQFLLKKIPPLFACHGGSIHRFDIPKRPEYCRPAQRPPWCGKYAVPRIVFTWSIEKRQATCKNNASSFGKDYVIRVVTASL